ncbi:hypothetical protein [Tritonibacter scottomollicae]|uniref:hypothetical protein n=1 Tax=Tritonibacter scottomollicae TaxID=483013 RepID=UPI003AA7B911
MRKLLHQLSLASAQKKTKTSSRHGVAPHKFRVGCDGVLLNASPRSPMIACWNLTRVANV